MITSARKNIFSWEKKQLLGIFIFYQKQSKSRFTKKFHCDPPAPLREVQRFKARGVGGKNQIISFYTRYLRNTRSDLSEVFVTCSSFGAPSELRQKNFKNPLPPLWLIIFGFGYATVNEARFMIFNRVMSAAKERKKIILIAR